MGSLDIIYGVLGYIPGSMGALTSLWLSDLTTLWLGDNNIGDQGMIAFSSGIASGSMVIERESSTIPASPI